MDEPVFPEDQGESVQVIDFNGFTPVVMTNMTTRMWSDGSIHKSRTFHDLIKTLMDVWVYSEIFPLCLEFPFEASYYFGITFSHVKNGFEERKSSNIGPYYNINAIIKIMDEEEVDYWALTVTLEEYDVLNFQGMLLPATVTTFHIRVATELNDHGKLDVMLEHFVEAEKLNMCYMTDLILNSPDITKKVVSEFRKHAAKFKDTPDTVINVDFGKR